MTAPRIALATMDALPDWEVDDTPLVDAFARLGAVVDRPSWSSADYDWAATDTVLLRTTWDYQSRLQEFLGWLDRAAAVTRVLNPPDIVRWNVRKRYLRDLEAAGVPVIPTEWLGLDASLAPASAGDLEQACVRLAAAAAGASTRFMLKPEVGATAWGTLPFTADGPGLAAAEAHVREWRAHGPMLLQPYLDDVEDFGETSIIHIGPSPAHGVRKIPVPGDYRVQDDWGASDQPWSPPAEALATAAASIEVARTVTGAAPRYARVDFLRDADGVFRVVELELVEPSLFLRHGPETAAALAESVLTEIAAI